jgi:hypothetical protein
VPRARRPDCFHVCEVCGLTFYRNKTTSINRFCSHSCRATAMRGESAAHWNGGTSYISKNGYRIVRSPDGREIAEHRLVMEQHLGRPLLPTEHVHHGPHGKLCNSLDNLVLTTNSEHRQFHTLVAENRWSRRYDCCTECGTTAVRHYAHGYCKRCYQRLAYHNAISKH